LSSGDWNKESDTAISRFVTKPKLFDEAIHFRAREGTKARIDALRGSVRQGDFIRELLEEALATREEAATIHDASAEAEHKAGTKRALRDSTSVQAVTAIGGLKSKSGVATHQEGNHRVAAIREAVVSAESVKKPKKRR
jgi:hypothetical protein